MIRLLSGMSVVVLLAACAEEPQQSGVGFTDYSRYKAEREAREAALRGQAGSAPLNVARSGGAGSASALSEQQSQPTVAVTEISGEDTSDALSEAAISDEQDFEAVSERETIESDRERLQRQREQFEIVQPEALPERPRDQTVNVVQFALQTSHAVGTQRYSRSPFRSSDNSRRCARYATADLAQEAFLSSGGPDRDRLGLDPDGDGYACGWDPAPFRQAVRN